MTAVVAKRRGSGFTTTDMFCGAGGSSIGAQAAGATVRLGMNHWRVACETYGNNHQDADVWCGDVRSADPRRFPTTDLLIASPECTNHSKAKTVPQDRQRALPGLGANEQAAMERSRATMWDVPNFVEYHRYEAIVVENVVDARKWVNWRSWLMAMTELGYDHEAVFLNSMVARTSAQPSAPQSRDRMYVVFWRSGNRRPDLDIRPPAWCDRCGDVDAVQRWKKPDSPGGVYRSQYTYSCGTCDGAALPYARPASEAIDWTRLGQRIGDRVEPLKPATMRRIETGLRKFGPEAQLVQVGGHTFERPNGYCRSWPTSRHMPTLTGTNTHGLMVPLDHLPADDQADRKRCRSTGEPLATQTGREDVGLVHPFLVDLHGGGSRDTAYDTEEPLRTILSGGTHHGLVVDPRLAFYVKNYGDGNDPTMSHHVSEPLGTVTGQDHHSLVQMPSDAFLTSYYRTGGERHVSEPMGTLSTRDRHALVEPAGSVAVEDCSFRMLEPDEIGRGMAFPDSYRVIGSKRDRVRQYGNAVTPPAMAVLLERVMGSLS